MYLDLVGKHWRGWYDVSVQWTQPGKEILEIWSYGAEKGELAGREAFRVTLTPGDKPGRLDLSITRRGMEGPHVGKLRDDGSVRVSGKGLLGAYLYDVRIPGPGTAQYDGLIADGKMLAHAELSAADAARNLAAKQDVWGVYSRMVGKQWLVDFASGRQLLTVDWKVPGEVIFERYDSLEGTSGYSQLITRDPAGKLLAKTNPPYTRVAYGEIDPEGAIHFRTRNVFALGQKWHFNPQPEGRVGYHFDTAVNAAQQSSMVPVSAPEARELLLAAKKAEQERLERERIARSERMAAFDRALSGFSTVLSATAQAYQESQVGSGSMTSATIAPPAASASGSSFTPAPGAGAVKPGSYATRPNTLSGSAACSGYTNENFQQHYAANSQGPDAQLHSLCAGAFNYYSMYLNAIRKGYSEADANRTYAAFEDAARVAERFYATAR